MKESKTTITDKLSKCYDLIDQAESFAYDGFYDESNTTWSRAAEIAVSLIKEHDTAIFTESEYTFLKTIINHIKEEEF